MNNYNLIHNNTNRRRIATITFSNNNEATVASKQIPVDILLYVGEGPIPHFHMVSKNKSFDCCICIFDNYYFSHDMHQTALDSVQRKTLNDFLSLPNHYSPYATNWQIIRSLWIVFNRGTDGRKEHYPIDQPDYTEIRPFSEYKTKKKSEKAYIKRLYKQ